MNAPAAARGQRYEALDSLRGVAACLVVLFHARSTGLISNLALVRQGWLAVDFFFVLSGFVIAAAYGEKLRRGFPLRAYMLLRLGRLYPLHLAMIGAFAMLDLAMLIFDVRGLSGRAPFSEYRSLPFMFAHLGLVQIFVPGAGLAWNGPSWSIAAEFWTYLLAALGLIMLKERVQLLLAAIVLAAPLVLIGFGEGYLATQGWLSLVRCLFSFSIGMLTFELHRRSRVRGGTTAELAALALGGAAVALLPRSAWLFGCPFLFAAAILVFAREEGAVSKVLVTRPFRAVGAWSYSIYMVHSFVLTLYVNGLAFGGPRLGQILITTRIDDGDTLQVIDGPGAVPDLLVIVALVLVVGVASFTYRWLELPGRAASRRRAERIADRRLVEAERVAPTM